jgi:hypothetical protein
MRLFLHVKVNSVSILEVVSFRKEYYSIRIKVLTIVQLNFEKNDRNTEAILSMTRFIVHFPLIGQNINSIFSLPA